LWFFFLCSKFDLSQFTVTHGKREKFPNSKKFWIQILKFPPLEWTANFFISFIKFYAGPHFLSFMKLLFKYKPAIFSYFLNFPFLFQNTFFFILDVSFIYVENWMKFINFLITVIIKNTRNSRLLLIILIKEAKA